MWAEPLKTVKHADALMRIGEWVRENGVDADGRYRAARDLLLRRPPRLKNRQKVAALVAETPLQAACRIASALNDSVLAIQGPPGAGKTYTGARMICQLVKRGKKIGITALSHKVIRKLLDEVVEAGREEKIQGLKCLQRVKDGEPADDIDDASPIATTTSNDVPLDALHSGTANVGGATSWLWTRP